MLEQDYCSLYIPGAGDPSTAGVFLLRASHCAVLLQETFPILMTELPLGWNCQLLCDELLCSLFHISVFPLVWGFGTQHNQEHESDGSCFSDSFMERLCFFPWGLSFLTDTLQKKQEGKSL